MKAAVMKRPQLGLSALPELVLRIRSNAARGEECRREVGSDLIQAKRIVPKGEWFLWLEDNFAWSIRTAQEYMELARRGGRVERKIRPDQELRKTTSRIAGSINFAAQRKEHEDEQKERQLMRTLSHKLIDIGFRMLAAKLHPDKPTGSKEAYQRLSEVKRILRGAL